MYKHFGSFPTHVQAYSPLVCELLELGRLKPDLVVDHLLLAPVAKPHNLRRLSVSSNGLNLIPLTWGMPNPVALIQALATVDIVVRLWREVICTGYACGRSSFNCIP